LTLAT